MAEPKNQSATLRIRADWNLRPDIGRGGDGYPPYNIERVLGGSPLHLRITIAVAGFEENELDIQLVNEELIVRGRQIERTDADYLFRGIATRQFQRIFLLSAGSDVRSARLEKGLLTIDVVQPQPDQTVRKINISRSE